MLIRILIITTTLATLGCSQLGERTAVQAPTLRGVESTSDGRSRLYSTRVDEEIELQPSGFRFEIPVKWLRWYEGLGGNLYLSVSELKAAKRSRWDWEKEYAQVTNAIFPFSRCAAHVGQWGWGGRRGDGAGLQVRVYDLGDPVEAVDAAIRHHGARAVTRLTREADRGRALGARRLAAGGPPLPAFLPRLRRRGGGGHPLPRVWRAHPRLCLHVWPEQPVRGHDSNHAGVSDSAERTVRRELPPEAR